MEGPYGMGWDGDVPFWKSIHEAGECDAGRVAYHRRKGGDEGQGPEDEPATR